MATTKKEEGILSLPPIDFKAIGIHVVGDTPLVVHRWSEKSKKEMRDKQQKKAMVKKAAKDPEQEYQDSLHRFADGSYGFPAVGFKKAAVRACTQTEGIAMTFARGAFHVVAEDEGLVAIQGEPVMREDTVRLQGSTADLRYRGSFPEWSADIQVRYNASAITAEQVVQLFNLAGFAVGIGENRPEKGGDWGMFHVESIVQERSE